ncbi:hypothetical protein HNY73_020786 [Argiope bruennichi]|uniref:Uncharacterized protein n=1 Tax=Argiope bruennichi TaxID=94029 RepID=A0A8T0EAM8_ARGBR|nr:hypothetical protein HNY73_020786 [Argiope bruennichi]
MRGSLKKMASTASDSEQGHVLSMDKAAFILIRIKKAFQKKKKGHLSQKPSIKKRIPLLRAKTLPAIITPSLSIIQAPLDPGTRSKIPTITTTREVKLFTVIGFKYTILFTI